MKLGSRSVLQITEQLFGLEDVPATVLGKCLEFEVGRVLLVGQWAKTGPALLYTAMRRTAEGGRSLRDEHWAAPHVPETGTVKDVQKEVEGETVEGNKVKKTRTAKPVNAESTAENPAAATKTEE